MAVVVLALAVRLFVALAVTPDPRDGRYDDTVWYDTTARHLAGGEGYVFDPTVWVTADGSRVYPDESELTPTALWPPGYPLTLAGIYAVTDSSVAAGRLANVMFGTLTVALVYLIALRLFVRLPAVYAGAMLALMPSHVLFTSVLLSETYFGFLLAAVLALCVYFVFDRDRPNIAVVAALGALVAFAGYVRGEFMAFGLVIALLLALKLRRESLLPLAALALGALVVITPWTMRNRITMGEWIAGTTGSGRVAYQGHNPGTDGGPSLIATGQLEARFAGLPRKEIELRSNEEGSRLAREWALDNIPKEIELVGRRMHLLFKTDEAGVTWLQSNKPWLSPENADRLINLSTAYFYGVVALALASLPLWWRRDFRLFAVAAVIPFYMLIFGVLFIGDPRYHYALYIPLAMFGGYGLAAVARLTASQWREVAGRRTLGDVLRTYGAR
jgi:4-amino-4-deoxy-L-arabinose transferase-like glycosyltransferase